MTFEEFAADRLPGVLRFAAVLTGDRALAEDLAQEVLIRAHSRWRKIGSLDRPEYYVRKMILNEFLHWRRREWRLIPSGAGSDVDHRSAPDHALGYAERDALFARLGKLPARQRAVLALRYYEGLCDIEIADLLGCQPGTVRGYAARALAALRVEMNVSAWSGTRIQQGENLMPTEEDLRIAFRDMERFTPDAAEVLRAVYDQPRWPARPAAAAAAPADPARPARRPGPGRCRGGGRGRGDHGGGPRPGHQGHAHHGACAANPPARGYRHRQRRHTVRAWRTGAGRWHVAVARVSPAWPGGPFPYPRTRAGRDGVQGRGVLLQDARQERCR